MSANSLEDIFKVRRKVNIYLIFNKFVFFQKLKKDKSYFKIYKTVTFFCMILISLQKQNFSNFIEIKLNHPGEQQIISDNYNISDILIFDENDKLLNITEKKIIVDSINDTIKLYFRDNIINFSHMFSNLKNITEVHIHNLLGLNMSFSYTFSNCKI